VTADVRRKAIAGMIVADLLVFGGWIVALNAATAGEQVKLPVEGYDPRDLLSGHYARFRLIAEREARAFVPPSLSSGAVEFCAESSADRLHVARYREGGEPCRYVLRGQLSRGNVQFDADRFYVDERRARDAASVRAGPETYVVAVLDGRGGVHVVDLVVDGKSLAGRR
jgi:uncharacterized membrane-anchored protein